LHLDTVDGDFPVSAVLTSASVHDSQVAIPLAQLTAQPPRLVELVAACGALDFDEPQPAITIFFPEDD
jgi:hypothetical protein